MSLSDQIKPISYVKSHASMILRELAEYGKPLIITQNGEAKAVLQDVRSFEQTQESMALLKILALGNRQVEDGSVRPAERALHEVRARRQDNE
jgi:prevent-host-death family protein